MFAAQTQNHVVALLLRLGLAAIFLYHGVDKIAKGDGGSAWVAEMYASKPAMTGFTPKSSRSQPEQIPVSLTFSGIQLAVAWGEFLGGLALAIGLLSRLAALGLIAIQIGAVCLVTAPRGFSFDKGGGYEYNLALLVMCLAVFILGAGAWSVDGWLARRRRMSSRHSTSPGTLPAGPHLTAEQVASGVENRS